MHRRAVMVAVVAFTLVPASNAFAVPPGDFPEQADLGPACAAIVSHNQGPEHASLTALVIAGTVYEDACGG